MTFLQLDYLVYNLNNCVETVSITLTPRLPLARARRARRRQ